MRKFPKIIVTVFIIFLAVGIVGGIRYAVFYTQSQSSLKSIRLSSRAKGNPQAPIHITEYIDFECPSCAQGAVFLKEYMARYPERIHLELKYYPLNMHRHAFLAAHYAECAARQNQFWPFHDKLIERQSYWSTLINARGTFDHIARDIELDLNQLKSCLNDEKVAQLVSDHKLEGKSQGVNQTPTYFVNGKIVVGMKSLMQEIERLVQEQNN